MAVLMAERIERPASLFGLGPEASAAAVDAPERERDCGLYGGPTLDEAIVGAWEGLAVHATVACPLCGGVLRPCSAADTPAGDLATGDPAGGRCGDCGTTLT